MGQELKHQRLYDWLVSQPAGGDARCTNFTAGQGKCAVEALKELTAMIMRSDNQEISEFLETTRIGIREQTEARHSDRPTGERDIPCTD